MKYPTSSTPSESGSILSGYSFRSGRSHLPRPATANLCSSATSKTTKYLRRLVKFRQMDFEFALWQMWHLFVAPQKVYRNFGYRKGFDSQFQVQNAYINFFYFYFNRYVCPENKLQSLNNKVRHGEPHFEYAR